MSSDTPIPIDSARSEGLYRDLELLLEGQVRDNPSDPRPMTKLLELYFEAGKREDFLNTAQLFNQRYSRELNPGAWEDVVKMGQGLLPKEQLFRTMADGIAFDKTSAVPTGDLRKRLGEDKKYAAFFTELADAYTAQRKDRGYVRELDKELQHTLNRPVSLMHAGQLSRHLGGAQIYLKREDLSPPLSHLNMAITGQAVLARKLGKSKLVATSTNGFRGVITASIARRLGMHAVVFIEEGTEDKQPGNLRRLELMGAEVHAIDQSILTKGDLREVALEYCMRNPEDAFMVLGLDAGPQPYPQMLIESVAAIGRETLHQSYGENRRLPSLLVARAGDNADAIGFFAAFLPLKETRLAAVASIPEITARRRTRAEEAFAMAYAMHETMDDRPQRNAKRILEGLEYPSVKREQAWLSASGRVEYPEVTVAQVRQTIRDFGRFEGLIPAIETAHALAYACEAARKMQAEDTIVVCIAEQVDKDIPYLDALMVGG